MDQINQLKKIIADNPGLNYYVKVIRETSPGLLGWIREQLPEISSDHEKIYLLSNDMTEPPKCEPYGSSRKIKIYHVGYRFCGHAEQCRCQREGIGVAKKEKPTPEQDAARVKKIRETKQAKYGAPAYNNREKCQETLMKNYGVTNPMKSQVIKDRLVANCLEKYGVTSHMKVESIKKKMYDSNVKNNGSYHTTKHISPETLAKINDPEFLRNELLTKTHMEITRELGLSPTAVIHKFRQFSIDYERCSGKSLWEGDVYRFVSGYVSDARRNRRDIIPPQEIDISIKSLNLAIECDGTRWHSESFGKKNINYHRGKTDSAESAGYRLIHIFESEWGSKQEHIKSRLTSYIGANQRYHARRLSVIPVDAEYARAFLQENHLDGYETSDHHYGLALGETVLMVMAFVKSPGDSRYRLTRFASKLHTNVVGGASRLFKHFTKIHSPEVVVSSSDRKWGTATVYEKMGFSFSNQSKPEPFYMKNFVHPADASGFNSETLPLLLGDDYNPRRSVWRNLKSAGYDRIWNCGYDNWVWNSSK